MKSATRRPPMRNPRAARGVRPSIGRPSPGRPIPSDAAAAADALRLMALAVRPASATLAVGRRQVRVSNLGKVLYPAAEPGNGFTRGLNNGFTKADVIDYYLRIADVMLPHLRGRAVTLKRFPDGPAGPFFYEKNCPAHRPPWVRTATVTGRSGGDPIDYCHLATAADLAWAANLAALELHTSLALSRRPDRPTCIAFDLDPGAPAGLADCCRLALTLRDVLSRLGLAAFPKVSGGKGLHCYVPLNTPCTFDDSKPFARAVALALARADPDRVTAEMRKDRRPGRVFIDWSQNDRHKTTACAYSLRAGPRPTVSAPVSWPEVERAAAGDTAGLAFHAADLPARVARLGDLFAPVLSLRQSLPREG